MVWQTPRIQLHDGACLQTDVYYTRCPWTVHSVCHWFEKICFRSSVHFQNKQQQFAECCKYSITNAHSFVHKSAQQKYLGLSHSRIRSSCPAQYLGSSQRRTGVIGQSPHADPVSPS